MALGDELEAVIGSFRLESPTAFSLLGERLRSASGESQATASGVSQATRSLLEQVLYARLHCRDLLQSSPLGSAVHQGDGRTFVGALSDANAGSGAWQSRWLLRGIATDGRVVVEKGGLRFWADPSGFRSATARLDVGSPGSTRLAKEHCDLYPGFYMALGNADNGEWTGPAVRIYWHLKREGAVALTARATEELNRMGVAFRLKLRNDPSGYTRTDAAVLYLPRAAYLLVVGMLERMHHELRGVLRTPVSAYVKPLAPGVGLAEDHPSGRSFGLDRSRLLADAMTAPDVCAAPAGEARVRLVAEKLHGMGLEPSALYLNPGSPDDYISFGRHGRA